MENDTIAARKTAPNRQRRHRKGKRDLNMVNSRKGGKVKKEPSVLSGSRHLILARVVGDLKSVTVPSRIVIISGVSTNQRVW